jgi:hypothetical protein
MNKFLFRNFGVSRKHDNCRKKLLHFPGSKLWCIQQVSILSENQTNIHNAEKKKTHKHILTVYIVYILYAFSWLETFVTHKHTAHYSYLGLSAHLVFDVAHKLRRIQTQLFLFGRGQSLGLLHKLPKRRHPQSYPAAFA